VNSADLVIVGVCFLSIIMSLFRGFVKEAISLAVWLAAGTIAILYNAQVAIWLEGFISAVSLRTIAAWVLIFIAVLLLGGVLKFLVSGLIKVAGLSTINRLLGAVFGTVRGLTIIMAALIMLPEVLPVEQDLWWQESLLIPEFLHFEMWARDVAASVSTLVQQAI